MTRAVSKVFKNAKFSPATIREAVEISRLNLNAVSVNVNFSVTNKEMTYEFDGSEEYQSEALRMYFDACEKCDFYWFFKDAAGKMIGYLCITYEKTGDYSSNTRVKLQSDNVAFADQAIDLLERNLETSIDTAIQVKPPKKQVVFIGHGRSSAWRDLKDHLSDKPGFTVEAYETGARSGHHIRDVLENMTKNSTIAFLIHTAEDEMADKSFQARPNVIHETGLFQGALGFSKAIILLENGCSEFSNVHGIQQIRFTKIAETFGEVLAVIRREQV
jgi:predicted nucleotide-binding protein